MGRQGWLVFLLVGAVVGVLVNQWGEGVLWSRGGSWEELGPNHHHVGFERAAQTGLVSLRCGVESDFEWGMGYSHAMDRSVQMVLLRTVAQGRVSELLAVSHEALRIDAFMREMNFAHVAAQEASHLKHEAKAMVQAYCDGVNHYWAHYPRHPELLLLGITPEPWRPADVILTALVMAYLPLAEVQRDTEVFIAQAFKLGVDPRVMKRLFSPFLDGVDDKLISLLKKVVFSKGLVSDSFLGHIPTPKASNNWVLAPSKSASGAGLGACDPHLDTARLPPFWYEIKATVGSKTRFGTTIPGLPGLLFGRNNDLFFSFTYGFMDTVDLYIEDITRERDGYYSLRAGGERHPVKVRKETIKRKGGEPAEVDILEADHCVLETPPLLDGASLPPGLYLCRAWANAQGNMLKTIEGLLHMSRAKTVEEGQEIAKHFALPSNHLFLDSKGNIGYQQTGSLPNRKPGWSGLHPLPSWEEGSHWNGFASPDKLIRVTNPSTGYLVTANDNVQTMANMTKEGRAEAFPLSLNLWMGYRIDRLHHLLSQGNKFTPEDMKRIQFDVFSPQAEAFMRLVKESASSWPKNNASMILSSWDLRLDTASLGAPIFDEIYRSLLNEFFGKHVFGTELWESIRSSPAFSAHFKNFDDFFLAYEEDRERGGLGLLQEPKGELVARVVNKVLSTWPAPFPTWGEVRRVTMRNELFRGEAPAFLGFDQEYRQPGSSATILQGGLFTTRGRPSTFAPSWRAVVDFGLNTIETTLPGGQSGTVFSRYYKNRIEGWLKGEYEKVQF